LPIPVSIENAHYDTHAMQRRGRLLLVSYYFPPAGGVASMRVTKLAKYLARAGWEVRVLTATPRGSVDESLMRDVEGLTTVVIKETRGLPTVHGFSWATAIVPVLRREALDADVVLVSGAPFAPFLAAALAWRRAPYVLDMRDLWADEPRFGRGGASLRSRVVRLFEGLAERVSLRFAAAVITVAPELAEILVQSHPRLAGQITVVPHGFDPEDVPNSPAAGTADAPVLLHAGTMLAEERTPALLIETARRVRANGTPLSVRLLGTFDERLRSMVADPVSEGWMIVDAPVDHLEAVVAAASATVLWLEPGPHDFAVTGKIYEYVASGRPIVVAASETNAAARLIRRTGGGILAGDTADSCADAVRRALAGDIPPRDASVIESLSLPRIVERLDELLRTVAR
jgi:glycosyltransferase involved in cell wall biosynthesis